MDWWYYAFAISLAFAVAELAVIIEQRLELRDLRMIAKAYIEQLQNGESDN